MADFVDLRPGMRVMIPSPEGVIAGYFSSTVRRIDHRGLLIDMPHLNGDDLPMRSGKTLTMFVQIHGRLYEFTSRVRSADLQVLLDEPGAAKRTERRSFFRLLLSIPARMTITSGDDEEPAAAEVMVLDLSGGGIRIRTGFELMPETELELQFATDRRELRLQARVIRSSAIELARGGLRHEAHCMFPEIARRDEDEIVRFVFQKQLEFSQRGLA